MIDLATLNGLQSAQFAATLGSIFEHSAWVAERAAASGPFTSRLHLLDAMRSVVDAAGPRLQLKLIRAHPQLGVRGRIRTELTHESAGEQRRAGLDACTADDVAVLDQLNTAYTEKFSMPFILAVRGHDPASIIATMKDRLLHDSALERRTALIQIGLIAGFRLADVIATPPALEIAAMTERSGRGDDTALVRQWMLAAGLDVSDHGADYLLGQWRCARVNAVRRLIGARADGANSLRAAGRIGTLIAIAVIQHLRQRGRQLPFDLLLLADPHDRSGPIESLDRASGRKLTVHEAPPAHPGTDFADAALSLERFLLQTSGPS